MTRFVMLCVSAFLFEVLRMHIAYGFPGVPADYNGNGIVSHSDYSVIADHFGSNFPIPNEGASFGTIDQSDFDFYVPRYGNLASSPGILPFDVVVAPVGGNLQWTLTFSNVNGGLAGHLNISTSGPSISSVIGGPSFLDDNDGILEVPGFNEDHAIKQGIVFSGNNKAFAALGTTLTTSPALLNSNSTLEFLRLVTTGTQPTTLTYSGEYGYQGIDYIINSSASFVPEPTAGALTCAALLLLSATRAFVRRSARS